MPDAIDAEDTHQRIRRRLEDDLQLADADVDGVMAIVEEEVEALDYVLQEWACDRCGENPTTARKGDEHLCNACIYGEPPLESDNNGN